MGGGGHTGAETPAKVWEKSLQVTEGGALDVPSEVVGPQSWGEPGSRVVASERGISGGRGDSQGGTEPSWSPQSPACTLPGDEGPQPPSSWEGLGAGRGGAG